MRKGFLFDHELCVACKACSAACMLENDWIFKARNIFTLRDKDKSGERIINLSMACNHCSEAACLQGCPSKAFYRDPVSSAIIIDPGKCIGCRYCLWNCPYEAPVYNDEKGIIEKCHLCNHRITEGDEPACSSACPTGALSFGNIPENINHNPYPWMPEKNLNPALKLDSPASTTGLRQVPSQMMRPGMALAGNFKTLTGHWILVLFTFVLTVAVSLNISASAGYPLFTRDVVPALLAVAGMISVFHISRMSLAWTSVLNFAASPLSREIAAFLLFVSLIILDRILDTSLTHIAAIIAGLVLLVLVDQVYNYSDPSPGTVFHSGQTFLTSLIITSYLLESYVPFLFIAGVKCVMSISILWSRKNRDRMFAARYMRLGFLLVAAMMVITRPDNSRYTGIAILLAGEFLDRILYYMDFKPDNIKNKISNQ